MGAEVRGRKDMTEKKAQTGQRRRCGSLGTKQHKQVLAESDDFLACRGRLGVDLNLRT